MADAIDECDDMLMMMMMMMMMMMRRRRRMTTTTTTMMMMMMMRITHLDEGNAENKDRNCSMSINHDEIKSVKLKSLTM